MELEVVKTNVERSRAKGRKKEAIFVAGGRIEWKFRTRVGGDLLARLVGKEKKG